MSITDELREWAKKLTHWWYDPVKDEYTYTTGTMPPSIDAIRMDSNIIAIADRIDAEHERKIGRAAQLLADAEKDRDFNYANWQDCKQKVLQHNITLDELSAEIERLEDELAHCIELPKDADGEPIHLGDKVYQVKGGLVYTVKSISFYPNNTTVTFECEHGFGNDSAHNVRHYHAPTVEDVLREFTDAILEWSGKSGTVAEVGTWSDVAAEYATKLRLAEGEDA